MNMISVPEAERIVQQNGLSLPAVACPVAEAGGLVLRQDVRADRDLPPFDRVTMDGIAIALAAWEAGRRTFQIEATQNAGAPPLALKDRDACIQVMTGAALPQGCDCVVPYEDLTIAGNAAELADGVGLRRMQNVHRRGSDRWKDEMLLRIGCILRSPEIAILASVGKSKVRVGSRPSVALVATGDELVDVDQPVLPYQVRRSNSSAMQSALLQLRCPTVSTLHARDDRGELESCLREALAAHDLLILSGGVSMGKRDFVPDVLKSLGAEALFHRVSQRPGKPLWFGKMSDGKPVFALPGNPVSALVCFHRYVLPFLFVSMGARWPAPDSAALGREVAFDEPLTYFVPVVQAASAEGLPVVTPVPYGGSGDQASLAETSGFVELPPDGGPYAAGRVVRYHRWSC